MAVIHVVGADHDSSAGEAANYGNAEFWAFLVKIIAGADLVYVADDSLRQDLRTDLFNRIRNMLIEDGKVDESGSIFISLEIMRDYLLEKSIRAEILPTTTTDIFNDNLSGTHYKEAIAVRETHKRLIDTAATTLAVDENQIKLEEISPFLSRQGIKSSTCLDDSKFLNVWLKVQEVALMHPEDEIIYHFLDDNTQYGNDLRKVFTNHPELLPRNVKFQYEFCDYYHGYEFRTERTDQIQGTGAAHADYRERVKAFVSHCLGESVEPRGEAIYGSTCVLRSPRIREQLTMVKVTATREKDLGETKTHEEREADTGSAQTTSSAVTTSGGGGGHGGGLSAASAITHFSSSKPAYVKLARICEDPREVEAAMPASSAP